MRKHSRALTAEVKGSRGEMGGGEGGARGKREKDNDNPYSLGAPTCVEIRNTILYIDLLVPRLAHEEHGREDDQGNCWAQLNKLL
jgi:hypothetical protein